ncbi:unnamed protein product [Allacma fusca]|uniref:Retrotransposon gag domain-containing protein n=1 Tax=Allacma fusca TaxID=39272 RepID=A0A8J2K4R4_9HEXA|nr:unnamed protein product [Allacma fusca]
MDTSATSNAPPWAPFDPFAGDLFGAAPDIPLDPPPNFQQQSQMHTYVPPRDFQGDFTVPPNPKASDEKYRRLDRFRAEVEQYYSDEDPKAFVRHVNFYSKDMFVTPESVVLNLKKLFQKSPDKAVQEWFRSEFPRIRLYEETGKPPKEIWQFVSSSLIQRFDHANLRPAKQAALESFRYTPGMSAESFVAELQHLCMDLDLWMSDDAIIENARGKLPSSIDSFAVTLSRNIPEFTKNVRGLLRSTAGDRNARSRTTGTSASQAPQLGDTSMRTQAVQICDYCNRQNHTWRQCRDFQRDVQQGYTDKLLGLFDNRGNRFRGSNPNNQPQGQFQQQRTPQPQNNSNWQQQSTNAHNQNYGDPNDLIQFHDCPPGNYQNPGNQSQLHY